MRRAHDISNDDFRAEKLMADINLRQEQSNCGMGLRPAALAALVAGGALAAYGVSRRYRQRKQVGGEHRAPYLEMDRSDARLPRSWAASQNS
jgi:hypothetical protein